MRRRRRVQVRNVGEASMKLGGALLKNLGVEVHKVVVKEIDLALVTVERCRLADLRAPLHSKFKS